MIQSLGESARTAPAGVDAQRFERPILNVARASADLAAVLAAFALSYQIYASVINAGLLDSTLHGISMYLGIAARFVS